MAVGRLVATWRPIYGTVAFAERAMFDSRRWADLQDGAACPHCRELLPNPSASPNFVATLASGPVLLQDDADFRGYCMLSFRRHATELFQLSDAERNHFMSDVNRVALAVWQVCRPSKLNYVILGNEVPHLHVHVIPRYPQDGWWGQPIWHRPPHARRTLAASSLASLRDELKAALGGLTT
jgi:diadenosine tetraphosphate (Ap4A) HIT family hydrolase